MQTPLTNRCLGPAALLLLAGCASTEDEAVALPRYEVIYVGPTALTWVDLVDETAESPLDAYERLTDPSSPADFATLLSKPYWKSFWRWAKPQDIDDDGRVVGYSIEGPDGGLQGFVWEKGVVTWLPWIPDAVVPSAIAGLTNLEDGGYRPMLDDGDGAELLALEYGRARGLSSDGLVVGSAGPSSLSALPTYWWHGESHPLSDEPGVAWDVNDANVAVGHTSVESGWQLPTRWEIDLATGEVTRLFLASMQTWGYNRARAINERGGACGNLYDEPDGSFSVSRAVVWTSAGELVFLGTLGSGTVATAEDVNDSMEVVGWSYPHPTSYVWSSASPPRAFLWKEGVMADLNDLLVGGDGWVLHEAYAINDDGWIVGTGEYEGEKRGFLLKPLPE